VLCYEVSSFGRVRSHAWGKLRILNPYPNTTGYLLLNWLADGKRHSRLLSHLVLEAFVGPRPEGKETRHLDGNRRNNHLSNLAWGTRGENNEDKVRHGTSGRKLTMDQAREIRHKYAEGASARSLGHLYGVAAHTVTRIVKGSGYPELPNPLPG